MMSYTECKKYVNDNNIKSRIAYIELHKTNIDIPYSPNKYYIEWVDWYDFLNKKRSNFITFSEAATYIKYFKLKSISEYRKWHKDNNTSNIPQSPDSYYKEWISWSNFLGHDYIATSSRVFLSFSIAKEFIKKFSLKTQKQWQNWIILNKKEYSFLPTCPEQIYDEFISYNDWLGTDRIYSNGELSIEYVLNSIPIKFIKQYKFNDCKYKRKLPFDFYLPELNTCIEYDGEQHFEPRFGNSEFKKTKIRDEIKTNYCLSNNIRLIRISYLDNIEDCLKINLTNGYF